MSVMCHDTSHPVFNFKIYKFKIKIGRAELKMDREIYLHNAISLFTGKGSNATFTVCQNRDFAQELAFWHKISADRRDTP